jgi:uncharacterized protein
MIRVNVVRSGERIEAFTITGHAGFANAGNDIVCAAVTVLVLNAINSCEKFLGVALSEHVVDNRNTFECTVPMSEREPEVQLFMKSMLFGIEQTSQLYPKHVAVRYTDENKE